MRRVPSGATLRKFYFSYTLHLTGIIAFPLVAGLLVLWLSSYWSFTYFAKASLLELFGQNATLEYIIAIFLGVVALIAVVFIISIVLSSFFYAKNVFATHARDYFNNSVYQNPFSNVGNEQSSATVNHSTRPPAPPRAVPATNQNDSLAQRYSESSDRARWGPK